MLDRVPFLLCNAKGKASWWLLFRDNIHSTEIEFQKENGSERSIYSYWIEGFCEIFFRSFIR